MLGTVLAQLRRMSPQASAPEASVVTPAARLAEVVRVPWVAVELCPACGSDRAQSRSDIPDAHYVFGDEKIALPQAGISIVGCDECGLHYKSAVPAPASLLDVFRRQAGKKWMEPHDYADQVAGLQRLCGTARMDVLDVGAASGGLLHACGELGIVGRRSALDVVRFAGIESSLSGEFIEGFLDDSRLAWSGEGYDVVTLFDVLEHLYQPQLAFTNLRALVRRNGLVFIETGNAESDWPRRYGINHWWYARLFEHHVFWCQSSLRRIAARHGFEITFWKEGRHKSRRDIGVVEAGCDLLKVSLYRLAPDAYASIARRLGKEGCQPWDPRARDHFQACLKKV